MVTTTIKIPPPDKSQAEYILCSDQNVITVSGPLTPEQLEACRMCDGLDNFRRPNEQHRALIDIARLPEGQIYAAIAGNLIVGYITFHYPEFDRWARSGIENILELGAIEVSRHWRGLGIAKALVQAPFETNLMEDKIIVSLECYHSWDLQECNLTVWEYKKMLEQLLAGPGFVSTPTDDPEIICHPANVLSVRIGSHADQREIDKFKSLLFSNRMFA